MFSLALLLSLVLAVSVNSRRTPGVQVPADVLVHPWGRRDLCLRAESKTQDAAVRISQCNGQNDLNVWTMANQTTFLRLRDTEFCASVGQNINQQDRWSVCNGAQVKLFVCPKSGIPPPQPSYKGQVWVYQGQGSNTKDQQVHLMGGYINNDYICLDNRDGAGWTAQVWQCHEPGHRDYDNQRWEETVIRPAP